MWLNVPEGSDIFLGHTSDGNVRLRAIELWPIDEDMNRAIILERPDERQKSESSAIVSRSANKEEGTFRTRLSKRLDTRGESIACIGWSSGGGQLEVGR